MFFTKVLVLALAICAIQLNVAQGSSITGLIDGIIAEVTNEVLSVVEDITERLVYAIVDMNTALDNAAVAAATEITLAAHRVRREIAAWGVTNECLRREERELDYIEYEAIWRINRCKDEEVERANQVADELNYEIEVGVADIQKSVDKLKRCAKVNIIQQPVCVSKAQADLTLKVTKVTARLTKKGAQAVAQVAKLKAAGLACVASTLADALADIAAVSVRLPSCVIFLL